MPVPKELVLAPHQIENATFLTSWDRAALYDDPGAGKTNSALAALDKLLAPWADGMQPVATVLIVCPTAVVIMWAREAKRWFPEVPVFCYSHIVAPDYPAGPLAWDDYVSSRPGIHVTTYDVLKYSASVFGADRRPHPKSAPPPRWYVVILDEVHYAKSWDSERCKVLFGRKGVLNLANYAWFLTGSPITRYADDLYPQFKELCPDHFAATSIDTFCKAFCALEFKRIGGQKRAKLVVTGNRNPDALWQALQGTYRRTVLEEATKGLPPLLVDVMPLELSMQDRGRVWQTLGAMSPGLNKLVTKWANEPDNEAVMRQIVAHLNLLGADQTSKLQNMLGALKVPLSVPVILEEVARHGKVLVLVQHIGSVLEPLLGLLTDAYGERAVLCVHGGVSSTARAEVETRFNEWPSVKVCIVQTRAGGVGLNLQKSCHRVIELEADWSGQSNRQGWARVYRWGQTHPVHVSRLTLAGTIDDACLAISEFKVADAANIITPTEKL